MAVDSRELRNCLGHFATGVTVVSCLGETDAETHGATVNAFSAVSLDPPLVLVSLDRRSRAAVYLDGKPFTVNVLTKPQDDLALRFAGRPRGRPPQWEVTVPGLPPRLVGSLAWIACAPWRRYDGGDHVLYLGEVRRFGYGARAGPNAASRAGGGAEPLVFYLGTFRDLGRAYEAVPWLESGDCPGISWFATTA